MADRRPGFWHMLRGRGRAGGDVVATDFVSSQESAADDRVRSLGTFGGVFTPSFLTIIGVIMYLRFSWVVGNAGLWQTLAIVAIANAITLITSLSVSSIASNERMETGGAYFIVSRVLGYQAGGGIGVPLYLSQSLSVALYVIGFAEAIGPYTPGVPLVIVALVTMVVLALIGIVGARLMVRVQYVILILITLSFVSIALGFRLNTTNFVPSYRDGLGFWAVFAVFFPAVTGILAGVSMSGDLRTPATSIPKGTLLSVFAGFIVYILVPVMLAFTVGRDELFASTALRDASRWPMVVTLGVIGATLSSAIGSLMAAPRTLQALGIDRIAPAVFERGVGRTQEPIVALGLTVTIATAAILLGSLNAVAEVLTMFFLTTYGVLNLSAGMEHLVDSPSYRPAIRVPSWVSFLGAAACLAVMVLISPVSAIVAVVAVGAIFLFLSVKPSSSASTAGGLWEGYWTARLLSVSRRLAESRSGSGKNWRPLVQVFASDVDSHRELVETASMLTRRGGALAIYAMVSRRDGATPAVRRELSRRLDEVAADLPQQNIFTNVVESLLFHEGVVIASQAAAFATSSYNTVMLGLPRQTGEDRDYTTMMHRLSEINRNVLLLKRGDIPWTERRGPIIVWWGGQENNVRLMVILAYLLQQSFDPDAELRLSTIVTSDPEAAEARLARTVQELRIRATTAVVVNTEKRPVPELLARESSGAALVVIGMAKPDELTLKEYLPRLRATVDGMGTVLLVQSNISEIEYV
ncbi:MAG: Na-K-Cl cotransporter [Spirochaetaceae bacterium]|nr:MAG: Na-K-Cl cotransporter [Spirochaetaceae bacterium]